MQRRLSGVVIIDGTDDELWPGSDETVHRSNTVNVVLTADQPATSLDIPDVRWGGECRVEVRITAKAARDGVVQVEGTAKLFEGASEDTTDLEDEQRVSFAVPRGGIPVHHSMTLRSTGVGGGDYADIGFAFTNSVLEE